MEIAKNPDGTVHEIVGESGSPDGEGCLREVAVFGASVVGLVAVVAAGVGGLVWALS